MFNKKHKLFDIKIKTLVKSLFIWNYKTNKKWFWIEFADYKEFNYGDDYKNIDFIKSSIEWKTLVKTFQEERELSTYFVIDLDETFFNSSDNIKKIDTLINTLNIFWNNNIKQWNKLWYFINYKNKTYFLYAKKGINSLIQLINVLNNIYSENNFFYKIKNIFIKNNTKKINTLMYFNSLKINKSLVFYFTNKTEIEAKNIKLLSVKNDFIFCNIFNSFENNLFWEKIVWLSNKSKSTYVDLNNKKLVEEYIQLRKNKINKIKILINKFSGRYLLIDENTDIYKQLFLLSKK